MSKVFDDIMKSLIWVSDQYGKGNAARRIYMKSKKEISERSYGVGRILKGELTKVSNRVFWDMDESICIIIRDLLRGFADSYEQGFPLCVLPDDFPFPEYNRFTDEETEAYREKWKKIVYGIADKVDYYLQHDGYAGEEDALQNLKEGCELLAKYLPYMWN